MVFHKDYPGEAKSDKVHHGNRKWEAIIAVSGQAALPCPPGAYCPSVLSSGTSGVLGPTEQHSALPWKTLEHHVDLMR